MSLLVVCECDSVLGRWPGVRFGLVACLCFKSWLSMQTTLGVVGGEFFLEDGRQKDCGGSGESRA